MMFRNTLIYLMVCHGAIARSMMSLQDMELSQICQSIQLNSTIRYRTGTLFLIIRVIFHISSNPFLSENCFSLTVMSAEST